MLWGRGWEDAGAPPYWPWVQALRTLLRTVTPEAIRGYLGSGAADVAQMLPELRTSSPTCRRGRRLGRGALPVVRLHGRPPPQCGARRPILIILDDLQAADTPSILLLQFLASQLSDMRLLIVGTYRDVELTPDHPLTPAIAEMAREPSVRVIDLEGSGGRGRAGDRGRGGHGADRPIAPPLARDERQPAVRRRGRPTAVGRGPTRRRRRRRSAARRHPGRVRAVIARRIGHLGGPTVEALRLGSALGPEFSLDCLRGSATSARPGARLVDEAVQAGLLLPVAGGRGRYRFSHDLVRETLYDEFPSAAGCGSTGASPGCSRRCTAGRRRAPRRARVPLRPGGRQPERHCRRRRAGRSQGDRLRPTRRRSAAAALAYEEAARLYRMALAVMDTEACRRRSQSEALLALGDVQARAGDLDGTDQLPRGRRPRPSRRGRTSLARAALGFGGRHQWARPDDTRLIPLLQDALVMLGGRTRRFAPACSRGSPARGGAIRSDGTTARP